MDDLMRLYESEGITPEQLVDGGVKVSVPEDFYQRVVAKHVSQKLEQKRPEFETSGLPDTRLLYYEDGEKFEFEARVLQDVPRRLRGAGPDGLLPQGRGAGA